MKKFNQEKLMEEIDMIMDLLQTALDRNGAALAIDKTNNDLIFIDYEKYINENIMEGLRFKLDDLENTN